MIKLDTDFYFSKQMNNFDYKKSFNITFFFSHRAFDIMKYTKFLTFFFSSLLYIFMALPLCESCDIFMFFYRKRVHYCSKVEIPIYLFKKWMHYLKEIVRSFLLLSQLFSYTFFISNSVAEGLRPQNCQKKQFGLATLHLGMKDFKQRSQIFPFPLWKDLEILLYFDQKLLFYCQKFEIWGRF